MPAFKHILVPTDFGEPADRALGLATDLARQFGARLTLLHVCPNLIPIPYMSATQWPFQEIEARAQRLLDSKLGALRARYANSGAVLLSGIPSHQITFTALELEADLIVMGTHGREGLPRMLIGSVAERVVRSAAVPVLTVGGTETPEKAHVAA